MALRIHTALNRKPCLLLREWKERRDLEVETSTLSRGEEKVVAQVVERGPVEGRGQGFLVVLLVQGQEGRWQHHDGRYLTLPGPGVW